jgi:hypothetical protein
MLQRLSDGRNLGMRRTIEDTMAASAHWLAKLYARQERPMMALSRPLTGFDQNVGRVTGGRAPGTTPPQAEYRGYQCLGPAECEVKC